MGQTAQSAAVNFTNTTSSLRTFTKHEVVLENRSLPATIQAFFFSPWEFHEVTEKNDERYPWRVLVLLYRYLSESWA